MNLKLFIDQAICSALTQAGAAEAPAVIKNSQRPEFGHYQANGVMGAAKRLGLNPRVLAGTIIEALDFPAAAKVEIAGPGFINIHLSAEFIAASLTELRQDSQLGVQSRVAETIVIDYSAPNLAKEMHILRPILPRLGYQQCQIASTWAQRVLALRHQTWHQHRYSY